MHSLDCVVTDYKNIRHAFNVKRGYDFAYFSNKNEFIHLRDSNDSNDSNRNKKLIPRFKLQ